MSFRLKPEEKSDKTSRYSSIFGGDKLDSLSQDSESTASVRERFQALLPQGENVFQRCVIVQKDEFGYGLTVSGENPVYVDSIKAGGAAQQAGVREGDMIVKVNGNLVAKSNHKDVVKLIKSGTYVSLTLLSRQARTDNSSTPPTTSLHSLASNTTGSSTPSGTSGTPNTSSSSLTDRPPFTSSPSMDWITGPQPVNTEKNQEFSRQKLNTIRHMYQQAKQDYNRIKNEYETNPSEKLANQLQDQMKTVKNIEGQLKAMQPQRALGHKRSHSDLTGVQQKTDMETDQQNESLVGSDSASSLSSPPPMDEPDNAISSPGAIPIHSPLQAKSASMGSYDNINVRLGSSPPHSLGIITMEDDDFESDDEHQFEDHGYFRNLNTLMKHPAHLSVFLTYLINNQNPAPMFFYMVTGTYRHGNLKEMRKWAYEIHSTFINERAPLHLLLDDDLVACVETVLNTKYEREDSLRTVFDEIRGLVHGQISELLQGYCNTRSLGLGSMYGDHELAELDAMDRAGQLRLIDRTLTPLLEQLLEKEEATERNLAVALCLNTFMKNCGVPRTQGNQRFIDRTGSFNEKDRRMFKFPKGSRKSQIFNHSLEPQHYFNSTYCSLCGGILWGVGNQGFQCQNCDQNYHKHCLDNLKESCAGHSKSKKDKSKRTSVLDKIITRKPSNNSPSAIKEAQMLHDSGMTSPSSTASFQLQETVPEDAETDLPSRVGKLVDRYQKMGKDEKPKEEESPPNSDKEKKRSSPVGRSESMKGRQKEKNGSGSVRRTKSDVTNDDGSVMKAINDQAVASSSSSSLSTKSTSPSISLEHMNRVIHESDSDFEVESELPPLDAVLAKDVLKKLKPKEKKRQDVINELFYTERSHLRNLKILEQVFYQPWLNDQSLPRKLVLQLLPNINDLVKRHSVVVRAMKIAKPKDGKAFGDVADILLDFFSGDKGDQFKKASALFCRNHRHALDQLKLKVKKDQKLAQFLQEAEANPLCRRLKLADLIPMQMQRLTKYRLLVENLIKLSPSNSGEHRRLQKALSEFKEILAYVNQAVKECENVQKLETLQKRMEKRPEIGNDPAAKSLNLTEHKLLYDGPLMMKDGKSKIIECHVVLLEDILVILQKQDEKMVLKPLSSKSVGSLKSDENIKFSSPVIPLVGLLTRPVATDRKAFFLVSISAESRMYELHAYSVDERDKWFRYISEAAETMCKNTPGGILKIPQPRPMKTQPAPEVGPEGTKEEQPKEEVVAEEPPAPEPYPEEGEITEQSSSPSDILRQTDRIIEKALLDKQRIIAEMLGMPADEFEHIAEIANAIEGEKEPRELIVGAILQMNRLTTLVKETIQPPKLPVPETTDDKQQQPGATPTATPTTPTSPANTVHLPVTVLLEIVNHLNQGLTQLLRITREREVDLETTKIQLKTVSEQMKLLQDMSMVSRSPGNSRPASFISVGSELSEESDDEVIQDEACSTPQPGTYLTPRDSLTSSLDDDGQITPLVMDGGMPQFHLDQSTDVSQDDVIVTSPIVSADKEDDVPVTLEQVGESQTDVAQEDTTEDDNADEFEDAETTEPSTQPFETETETVSINDVVVTESNVEITPDEDSEVLATERTETIVEAFVPDTLNTEHTDGEEETKEEPHQDVNVDVNVDDVDDDDADIVTQSTQEKSQKRDDLDDEGIHVVEDHFDRGTDEFELD